MDKEATALHQRHWCVENYGQLFRDKRSRGNMEQLVVSKEGFYLYVQGHEYRWKDCIARP